MKRSLLFQAALVVVLLAQAAPPAQGDGSTDRARRAAVRAYWTPERMERALPRDVVLTPAEAARIAPAQRGSDATVVTPRQPLQLGDFDSHEVTTPSNAPYRAHGKVFFSDGDGFDYVCSGTVVTSANESTIATAGHCVHGDSEFMTNWMFVPAYRNGNAPFGEWAGEQLWTTDGWAEDEDFRYDLAFVRVEQNGGTIEDAVGSRGIAFNGSPLQEVDAFGHPAGAPFNGEKMWVCETEIDHREGSGALAPLGIPCDMTGGSSGGGWIVNDSTIHSVVSFGILGLPDVLYGPYLGTVAQDLYEEATGGEVPDPDPEPTPSPDPEPTEPGPDPDPEPPTVHDMGLTLKLTGHLKARGRIRALDGYAPCRRNAPIEIYRINRNDVGIWVGETVSDDAGRYSVRIRDRRGIYFAYSPRGYVNQTDSCSDAYSGTAVHN